MKTNEANCHWHTVTVMLAAATAQTKGAHHARTMIDVLSHTEERTLEICASFLLDIHIEAV